jgi:hypothetical protein
MKHQVEKSITDSLRLYEELTGRRIRELRWSTVEKNLNP